MTTSDPVVDLLLSVTGPVPEAGAPELPLPTSAASWRRLAQLSQLHSVEALVAPLALKADACPAEVAGFFTRVQDESQLIRKANLLAQAEITDACRSLGIPIILLKGAGLAERFFADPSTYCSRDIDLLARPDDLAGVEEVLRGFGYTAHKYDEYRRTHFHTVWMHNRRSIGGCVELHWDVTLHRHNVHFPLSEWWGRAPEMDLAAGPILLPPPADEISYLAWHMLLGGATRLRELGVWARAFAALDGGISVDDLHERAHAAGAAGFMSRAAILAVAFWDIDARGCEQDDSLAPRWRRLADIALAPDLVLRAGQHTWSPLQDFAYWSMLPPGRGGMGACCRYGVERRLGYDLPARLPLQLLRTCRYTFDFWRVLMAVSLRGKSATDRLGKVCGPK